MIIPCSSKFHLRKSVEASGETAFLFQRKFVLVSARCLEVIAIQGHVQLNCLPDDLGHRLKTVRNLSEKYCCLSNTELRFTTFLLSPSVRIFFFNTNALLDFKFTWKFKDEIRLFYTPHLVPPFLTSCICLRPLSQLRTTVID